MLSVLMPLPLLCVVPQSYVPDACCMVMTPRQVR
jgi:hypothetical protein